MERLVEVEIPVTVVREVTVEVLPRGGSWANTRLNLLQIDRGRIYDRDLAGIAQGLDKASKALTQRS